MSQKEKDKGRETCFDKSKKEPWHYLHQIIQVCKNYEFQDPKLWINDWLHVVSKHGCYEIYNFPSSFGLILLKIIIVMNYCFQNESFPCSFSFMYAYLYVLSVKWLELYTKIEWLYMYMALHKKRCNPHVCTALHDPHVCTSPICPSYSTFSSYIPFPGRRM